jgi:release factor glutamine methyltransferase
MSSVHEQIAEARQTLVSGGISPADAALDAEVLARHALGWDRAALLARGRETAPVDFAQRFAALIRRRAAREPVAFITGHREFWGLDFEVTHDVLIPRPETELVIEAAIDARRGRSSRRIVDVGTGSGCLAVVLALEFPDAQVIAIDVSAAALTVAARNAAQHGVLDQITLIQGDLLTTVAGPVDLIVANPPYVSDRVRLSPEIIRYEPPVALYSGDDGLTALERLIPAAQAPLADDGHFVVEFGAGQDDAVSAVAAAAAWRQVTIKEDLQGIPRVAVMAM